MWMAGRASGLASLPELASYPPCAGAARLDAFCLFASRGSLVVFLASVCVYPVRTELLSETVCGHVCGGQQVKVYCTYTIRYAHFAKAKTPRESRTRLKSDRADRPDRTRS